MNVATKHALIVTWMMLDANQDVSSAYWHKTVMTLDDQFLIKKQDILKLHQGVI